MEIHGPARACPWHTHHPAGSMRVVPLQFRRRLSLWHQDKTAGVAGVVGVSGGWIRCAWRKRTWVYGVAS